MTTRNGEPARQRILNSAVAVVKGQGAGHLTIDGVARHSGLSKGGVLYHFPSKSALIEAMLARLLSGIEDRTAGHVARLQGANVSLRALCLAESGQLAEENAMSLAILAAAAEDPSLLDPVRNTVASWFGDVRAESQDSEAALLVLLANQGLRFLEMLDLLPLNNAQISELRQRLLDYAEQNP